MANLIIEVPDDLVRSLEGMAKLTYYQVAPSAGQVPGRVDTRKNRA